jgi:pimeloyl-ACP methyl ester carboxylesterase
MARRPFVAGAFALAAAFLVHQWKSAFDPSPIASAEDVQRDGGHALTLRDGRMLEYFVHGAPQGEKTLLALHGAQTTGKLFELLSDWARANNVRIIAPTLPGFGLSTHNIRSIAPADWVEDALEMLSALKVQRFSLLGTSLGSIYAAALVARHPEPESILGIEFYVPFAPATLEHDPLAGSMLDTFGKLRATPQYKRFLEKLFFIPIIYYLAPAGSDVRRAIATQWEGMNACADVIYTPWPSGWEAAVSNGKRRVVIVSGKKDAAAPPHNQKRLRDLLPGSELVEYDGPHEHSLKHPSLFAEHVSLIM